MIARVAFVGVVSAATIASSCNGVLGMEVVNGDFVSVVSSAGVFSVIREVLGIVSGFVSVISSTDIASSCIRALDIVGSAAGARVMGDTWAL